MDKPEEGTCSNCGGAIRFWAKRGRRLAWRHNLNGGIFCPRTQFQATPTKELTRGQLESWLADHLNDPEWVAKMKARSDEADDQMRAAGLLDD